MFQITIKQQFIQHLIQKYPSLISANLESLVADQLLSPITLELPQKYLQEIKNTLTAFHELRTNPFYQSHILQSTPELENHKAPNFAVCNSLDFHITPEQGHLKLIEINTNASFLALGLEMYASRGVPHLHSSTDNLIASMFQEELKLFGHPTNRPQVAIVDDFPEHQKMYAEFLVYREYLRQKGFNAEIFDLRDSKILQSDLIYNRSTDFFLSDDASISLKNAYIKNQVGLSPNPWEYALLADKTRFIDWTEFGYLDRIEGLSDQSKKQILKVLPRTYTVTSKKKEDVWAERKKLFFKPKRSFGSKQTLKGTAVRHNAFEEIYNPEFIAQELINPSEIEMIQDQSPFRLKYDLRCYFYQNQLQSIVARLYQGQVTNLRTPNGGYACVIFK